MCPECARDQVRECRAQGYVFDNQENEAGIVCYGAPIREATGSPVASISVSVPMFRCAVNPSFYSDPVLHCVECLSKQLGYVP